MNQGVIGLALCLASAGCGSSPATEDVAADDSTLPAAPALGDAAAGQDGGKAGGASSIAVDSGTARDGSREGSSAGGIVKIGLIADIHEGRNDGIGDLITDAVKQMTPWQPDVLVALGDLVDHAGEPSYGVYLFDLLDRYAMAGVPRMVFPGNHDFNVMDLPSYLLDVPDDVSKLYVSGTAYGTFDVGGLHLVMLDGEYGVDGTHNAFGDPGTRYVPEAELSWLKADLAATTLPTIVLSHEALAGPIRGTGDRMSNYAAVVGALESSGKVIASFSGHTHADEYATVHRIHYVTLSSLFDLTMSPGYTPHDKGSHGQVTVDLAAHTLRFEFWENDSVNGYRLAHTEDLAIP